MRVSLDQWLLRLEQLHPREIELGLERSAEVAERLGLLKPGCPVVTVAGTNGKGSVIAVLDAILRSNGWRTGVYTSPHLLKFNERICVDGAMATDAELVESFERIDAARGDTPLTYFEFSTLAALDIFRAREVDILLLEVGMGGRLDAVNILSPQIAIVTSIALDHESWLGHDRGTIALEKAGILRPGIDFICADLDPPAPLCERARELGCRSYFVDAGAARAIAEGLPLRGENILAACRAAALLGVQAGAAELRTLLRELKLTARLQTIGLQGVEILLDVAHNPAAVRNLADFLREKPSSGRTMAVFAALSDKNIRAMIQAVGKLVDGWFVADLPKVPRAAKAHGVVAILQQAEVEMISISSNPRQAYRRARSVLRRGDRLLIFGSFHIVAAVLPGIEKDLKKIG